MFWREASYFDNFGEKPFHPFAGLLGLRVIRLNSASSQKCTNGEYEGTKRHRPLELAPDTVPRAGRETQYESSPLDEAGTGELLELGRPLLRDPRKLDRKRKLVLAYHSELLILDIPALLQN